MVGHKQCTSDTTALAQQPKVGKGNRPWQNVIFVWEILLYNVVNQKVTATFCLALGLNVEKHKLSKTDTQNLIWIKIFVEALCSMVESWDFIIILLISLRSQSMVWKQALEKCNICIGNTLVQCRKP
jgi:hypothetical protein